MKTPKQFQGANCAGTDPESFFPAHVGISTENMLAKKICENCICKEDCLTYALHYRVIGIWAGTTAIQRRKMRKQLNISAKEMTIERFVS